MNLEIIVEDRPVKEMLDILLPKILGKPHTFRVVPYKSVGRIPRDLKNPKVAKKRILMDNVQILLHGYGRAHSRRLSRASAVVLVCNLDDHCLKALRSDLFSLLNDCQPRPEASICITIEENEAWFLGDLKAVKAAFPQARDSVLDAYENDSICGTWETLADAVYPGGSSALAQKGWPALGIEKSRWAATITPHMNIRDNKSPSFRYFLEKIRGLIDRHP